GAVCRVPFRLRVKDWMRREEAWLTSVRAGERIRQGEGKLDVGEGWDAVARFPGLVGAACRGTGRNRTCAPVGWRDGTGAALLDAADQPGLRGAAVVAISRLLPRLARGMCRSPGGFGRLPRSCGHGSRQPARLPQARNG